ncbi:TPA: hypothetical protein KDY05_002122 [Vibrio parahaemolyticus]|nr:hypothetical protein [Vibrio parahaemolyticus]
MIPTPILIMSIALTLTIGLYFKWQELKQKQVCISEGWQDCRDNLANYKVARENTHLVYIGITLTLAVLIAIAGGTNNVGNTLAATAGLLLVYGTSRRK